MALDKLLAQLGQHVGAGHAELMTRLHIQDQRLGTRCFVNGWRIASCIPAALTKTAPR
jgi:hypothetical protein